jgi:two-component system sensor histidine kinase CpxA
MSRLFFKVFIWFWLAQIIIGFVLYQTMSILRPAPEGNRWRMYTNSILPLQARSVATIYEHKGMAALAAEVKELKTSRTTVFAYDGMGKQLAGPKAPPEAGELAVRAARSKKSETLSTTENLLVARSVILDNGRPFIWLAVQRQRPPDNNIVVFDVRNPTRLGHVRTIALLITSGFVCYGLALYLASPAVKLRRATQQLAGGDLSARVAAQMGRRRDELADLGRDFDQMAERIESLMTSERRLLADISHELRSPLARLMVALDLAEGGTDDATQAYLDRIRRESQRLNDLIGQLLSLSKLESGTARVENNPVDLSGLLREVAHDAEFEAQSSNRSVRLLHIDDCSTTGDTDLLRSAIENVVRNAVRYTAEGSEVELSLHCRPIAGSENEPNQKDAVRNEAVISVRDHGPGVPANTLEKLFRPFYRVADARDRQSGGTGLGLAITERAVRFHGGSLAAENVPDGGLKVTLSLPLKKPKKCARKCARKKEEAANSSQTANSGQTAPST